MAASSSTTSSSPTSSPQTSYSTPRSGRLEVMSAKRRLSFIKRWQLGFGYALLAATDHRTFMSKSNPKLKDRYWHPIQTFFNVNYDGLNATYRRINPFSPFQVIVPLLYYVGVESAHGYDNIHAYEVQATWRDKYRRQIGAHVFLNRFGEICQVHSFIQNKQYLVDKPHNIDSAYPVIRYETHSYPLQRTALGLEYTFFYNYDYGDRYYHRFKNTWIRKGGVFEITKQMHGNLSVVVEDTPYFGFFVCAGARLTVFDECQDETNSGKHNLALIQQGGMVFIKVSTRHDLNFTEGFRDNRNFLWEAFIERLESVNGNTDHLHAIRNPIIFIGANDSNHNSIAWSLTVEIERDEVDVQNNIHYLSGELMSTLRIPEGGRIVAIADGADGIQEINERIHYELLHDSVLTNHRLLFRACPPDRITRILNVNEVRSYYYIHRNFDTPVEKYYPPKGKKQAPIPLFRQFNVRKVTGITQEYLNKQKTMCPPLPPMYPLLYTGTGTGSGSAMIHIPNKTNRDSVENSYPREKELNTQSTDPYEQNYYFYDSDQKKTIACHLYSAFKHSEHNWKRLKNNPMYKNNLRGFGKGGVIDGVNKRIGVDGWIWEKQPDSNLVEPPFLCESIFYCSNVDKVDALANPLYIPPRAALPQIGAQPPTQPLGSDGWQVVSGRRRR